MFEPKDQQDIVDLRSQEDLYSPNSEQTEDIKFPGVATMHELSKAQIAEIFTNILKSRPRIIGFEYKVGRPFVRITYLSPP